MLAFFILLHSACFSSLTDACIFQGEQSFQRGKDGFYSGSLSIRNQQLTQRSPAVCLRFCILLPFHPEYNRLQSRLPLHRLEDSQYARTNVSLCFGVSSLFAQSCFVLNRHKHTSLPGISASLKHRCLR